MTFELKYHQATFDMLTRQVIDPRPFLAELDQEETDYRESLIKLLRSEGSPLADNLPPIASSEEQRLWTTMPLFGSRPERSLAKVQMLDAFERRANVQLPASFREWYSLNIGLSLLYVDASYSPNSIDRLGSIYYGSTDLLNYPILAFIEEQQGGYLCICLDEGDDPPVYWLSEESDLEQNPPEIVLDECAPRFSDFVYCFLWDWLAYYQRVHCFTIMVLSLRGLEKDEEFSLTKIQSQFQEVKQQWLSQFRFFSNTQRFSFPQRNAFGKCMAYADNETALRDLIRSLWGDHPPVQQMLAFDEQTKRVIESLRPVRS